jgi:hypothetical protein
VENIVVSLNASRFSNFEHKNRILKVEVPVDHTVDMMLEPAYWAHVARGLRNGDEIRALADDNSFYATFIVVHAGPNWANVKNTGYTPLDVKFELPEDADDNFEVEFGGNHHKWRVRRRGIAQPLFTYLPTKEAALTKLKEYKKSLAIGSRAVKQAEG